MSQRILPPLVPEVVDWWMNHDNAPNGHRDAIISTAFEKASEGS
jgi:hypothetical protein